MRAKIAQVIALLEGPGGATLAELVAATGWLPHTTRAALTGLRKRRAFNRSDMLERRRPVMHRWAAFLDGETETAAKVVSISRRKRDAPAYLTLLVVCHVIGAGVLLSDNASPQTPLFVSVLMWLAATALLSLLILPRMKGAVVGCQWALRMHGFSGREDESRALGASGKAASRR